MRLFVIGNGFDIDHGLKSKFKDFKEFLEQTYVLTFNREYVAFPNVGMGKDGEEVVDSNSASQILYALINEVSDDSDWRDFEDCLGELNYQEVLDLVDEDEENPFHYNYNLQDTTKDLRTSLLFVISNIFSEWAEGIDISTTEAKYTFLEDDLFLTFNYTSVLEDIYGIPKDSICHLHGSSIEHFCITGHGNDKRSFNDYDDIISFEINNIHDCLRKNVETIYKNNYSFFKKIYYSNITEIVFFGFSFGQADLYYIKQLFNNINTNDTKIFLSTYEDKNEKNIKLKTIKLLGFNGKYFGAFDKRTKDVK